ncbi:universal stress protein [Rudanella paleaurantiibacter]|uniref:Universal stress protein n=1 Tax=Rudanella paleaurantiibacter TaxID=2614655 RepID=A0A7J5U5U9_9BACT|nr:universal stress protein [Rudanella paleaurantiibacter]KAB7733021.1 universal stress protein [Rudanella paleaurantiibacter]
MKTIVLATDFSDNAERAARFALQMAQAHNAQLVLVNAYQLFPENPIKAGDFPLSITEAREESLRALKKLGEKLRTPENAHIHIRAIAKEGGTREAILAVAHDEKADLLVLSTVGTAPQSAQVMGSVATDMVGETDVPLLLIPPSAQYGGIDNVALAIDLAGTTNAIALDAALRFARTFGAVVNILCVNDKPDDEETKKRAEHIRRLTAGQPHTLTIESAENVYEAILSFARAQKADLIMMLPQEHSWFARLLGAGETQRVARLTDIPLLAVV